jgi:hypothetical protein
MIYHSADVPAAENARDQSGFTRPHHPFLRLRPPSFFFFFPHPCDVLSFPPSSAQPCLLYKSPPRPHHLNTRTTPQSLCFFGSYSRQSSSDHRHAQSSALPCLSLEAVLPHRAMCGPPSRLFPPSILFDSLISPFAQRRFRPPHVYNYHLWR